MTTAYATRMASPKQYAFIAKLIGEKELSADPTLDQLLEHRAAGDLDSRDASRLIDLLMAAPRRQQATLPLGYYVKGGVIYKVVESAGGNCYAKVQTSGAKFTYAPGVINQLTPEMKLTPEIASQMSLEAQRCCMCHKKIEVSESVARGIGPKCYAKLVG